MLLPAMEKNGGRDKFTHWESLFTIVNVSLLRLGFWSLDSFFFGSLFTSVATTKLHRKSNREKRMSVCTLTNYTEHMKQPNNLTHIRNNLTLIMVNQPNATHVSYSFVVSGFCLVRMDAFDHITRYKF